MSMPNEESSTTMMAIIAAEPRLLKWTKQAAHSYALFAGANDALRDNLDPRADASQLAALYREDAALMTAVRVFALFDRSADVSFQTVKCGLSERNVCDLLIENYVGQNTHIWKPLAKECVDAIERYRTAYSRINISALRRLHHFRNLGLAHISWADASKLITFDELRQFVFLAAELAEHLTLACRALNDRVLDQIDGLADRQRVRWVAAIQREIEGRKDTTLEPN